MNIALTILHFSSRASLRSALASAAVCGALLAGAIGPAWAEPGAQNGPQWGRREGRDEAAQRAQQNQPQPQSQPQRDFGARRAPDSHADVRALDEQRHMAQGADPARRNGRLTPDERRDLRRQINEAGQDIYAAPPRR